jgi:hypothetical protein
MPELIAPELRTETMTVNMGPQHPSTHGVLRLVLELSGETVINADTTIGFLHTGIEKTAEQKKWQQVIPLVERMDYLGAQSNSLAFCMSVERLLGIELPDRVTNIRVLIAELQRITSHLVWLGTHALEIGAVSVMMYCFRERELLLNINEMLAGFRMFPSYLRIGGLREDLPSGFHDAVQAFLDRFPGKLNEYEGLLTKNQIWLKRTKNVGVLTAQDTMDYGLVGPIARASGVGYDVRRTFPYGGRRLRTLSRARGGDATEHEDRASGARAHHAPRRVRHSGLPDRSPAEGQGIQRDGRAHPALPHLLAGLHRAGGGGVRADRRSARRARVLDRVRRHQSPLSHQASRAILLRLSGTAEDDRRRADR